MGKEINKIIKIVSKSAKSSARKTYNQNSYRPTPERNSNENIRKIGVFLWIVGAPFIIMPKDNSVLFMIGLIIYLISIPLCCLLVI